MFMAQPPRVILIGGAPLAGKSTAALQIASRLSYASMSTDDIGTVIYATTAAESYPFMHSRRGSDSRRYYLETLPEKIEEDSEKELALTWRAAEVVIRQHASSRCPAVIEGWALRPEWVQAA